MKHRAEILWMKKYKWTGLTLRRRVVRDLYHGVKQEPIHRIFIVDPFCEVFGETGKAPGELSRPQWPRSVTIKMRKATPSGQPWCKEKCIVMNFSLHEFGDTCNGETERRESQRHRRGQRTI